MGFPKTHNGFPKNHYISAQKNYISAQKLHNCAIVTYLRITMVCLKDKI